MKIAVISDLHLDFYSAVDKQTIIDTLNSTDADVIVNAGDLYENRQDRVYFEGRLNKPHWFIPGNHDYYGGRIASDRWENEHMVAATLWTNFGNDPLAMYQAMFGIHDFRSIKSQTGDVLYPQHMVQIFEEHRKFILDSPRKVVMSHYPPSHKSIAERFKGSGFNPYFVNNFSIEGTKLWIHGHTHSFFDYEQEGCRVVCNPLGYPGELFQDVKDYKPLILTI